MRTLLIASLGWIVAGSRGSAEPVYDDVLIAEVPHVRQKPDFCGEACAEMMLRKLGHELDQDAGARQGAARHRLQDREGVVPRPDGDRCTGSGTTLGGVAYRRMRVAVNASFRGDSLKAFPS